MKQNNVEPLVILGAGVGIGAFGLFAIVQALPLLVVGAVTYLLYKGTIHKHKENIS